jgi:hypothetical protein
VELNVMYTRRRTEEGLKTPIVDEYGLARIVAMIADIEAQYAASSSAPAPASGL